MPEPRRVVITGIGLVSPLGNSVESLWEHLTTGKSGVTAISEVPEEAPSFGGVATEFAGHINDFGELEKSKKKAIRKGLKLMCRESQMGVATAQAAISDAGLDTQIPDPDRIGVIYGTDYMMTLPEDFLAGVKKCTDEEGNFDFTLWAVEGMPLVTPLWLLFYLPNMPASHVAIYNDFRGPNNSLTHREAAANLAVGESFAIIERGDADIMLSGATGTRIHPTKTAHALLQEEIANDGTAPTEASRPFDRDRSGMVLGEGSGALMLESLENAEARGAHIYGEIIGRSSSAVAERNLVADQKQALINVMKTALADAGLQPSEVGHIHAHGCSTRTGDADEAAAITEVFGPVDQQPPVVALKSYTGQLGAGSGLVELIASLVALEKGTLFPVLNYATPDENASVAVVTEASVSAGDCAINISVSPQGQASAIVIRKWSA